MKITDQDIDQLLSAFVEVPTCREDPWSENWNEAYGCHLGSWTPDVDAPFLVWGDEDTLPGV